MGTWQQEGGICIRYGTKCVEVSFRKDVISYGKGGKLSELTSNEKNGFKGITYISLLAEIVSFQANNSAFQIY